MTPRDQKFDKAYFDESIDYKIRRIPEQEKIARAPMANPGYRPQYIFDLFIKHYELLYQRYCRGDDLNDMKAFLPEVVRVWEWAYAEETKVVSAEDMVSRKGFAENLDIYIVSLWLISVALCLEVDDALFTRMVTVADHGNYNQGKDLLFERLVACRIPGRPAATALLYPKPYEKLYKSIDGGARRVEWMTAFIQSWYPALKKAYWHERHTRPEAGYFGYWCFEAAAVAKLFHYAPGAYSASEYFPKDLAQYRP